MRILIVSQYYYPEPFRISDICEQLVKDGHTVTVLTSQPNYPEGKIYKGYVNEYKKEIINDVILYRTKIYPRKAGRINLFLNYISFVYYSKKVIRKMDLNFDAIFLYQLSPIFSILPGIKIAKRKSIKTILYCLDLWPESLVSGGIKHNSLIYKVFEHISKKIYQSVDKIAITSKSFATKFNDIEIENTIYLPQYAEKIFDDIKRTETKGFNFVFAGNIGEMQSVNTIIETANLLKDYKDMLFHIVGDGSKLENCRKLSQDMNLENVIFHGRKSVSEIKYYYSIADAMIVTLKNDEFISKTLPGKVQSYMAAGKIILASASGETQKIIEESKSGLVCKPEDPKAFKELILEFINTDNKTIIEQNSLEYYKNTFSKEIYFEKLYKILMEEI